MEYLLYWADLDDQPGISDIDIRLGVAKAFPQMNTEEAHNLIDAVSKVLRAIPQDEEIAVTPQSNHFVLGRDYSVSCILEALNRKDLDLSEFDDESPAELGTTTVTVHYMNSDSAARFILAGYDTTEPYYICSFVDEGLNQLLQLELNRSVHVL